MTNYMEYRTKLEELYNTADHPKAERLYEIAWDHGHANGDQEIEYWYAELVNLIR